MSTLLIDADMLCYRPSVAAERVIKWDPEDPEDPFWLNYSSLEDALGIFYGTFEELKDLANTDDVLFVFSDPAKNFRHDLSDDYKGSRAGSRKPICYWPLVEYVKAHYPSETAVGMEGDDLLGIRATDGSFVEPIIWSLDKDLKQIPGLHLIDDEVVSITKKEGDHFHLLQTLAGDIVDGYSGCPSVGRDKAHKYLKNNLKLSPYEHTFKRGARKGETETRYEDVTAGTGWETVMSFYAAQGLSEAYALNQARLAKILQTENYDNGEIKLWTPK